MSDESVCDIIQKKEFDSKFVWLVLIVLSHTEYAAACCYTAFIKLRCWNQAKSLD